MVKDIEELRQSNELIDLFCTLVQIPSPSGEEEKVSRLLEVINSSDKDIDDVIQMLSQPTQQ